MNDTTRAPLTPLQRAFLALEDTRVRLVAAEAAARESIAIIGIGCRVPGADGPDAFWRLLRDGVDAIGPLPAERWDNDALYDPDPDTPGRIAARGGGFLRDIDRFDAGFFGIARREAEGIDPQQRLLLEVSWEALEHAGQAPDRLERSHTGVYVGVCSSDYAYLQLQTRDPALLDSHFASGIAHSITSGRLSYLLGLQGPSLSIDTACSSSLVAVHLACQALRAGDCRMALAGGVNLILSPELYIALSHSRMLAPDGRCKTFDASADGFARGEGCGVVVLKRLSHAEADGDRILAVIRGSAVNQDGPSSGLTAPNGPQQEAVIRDALERAGVAPHEVGVVEAHGTGTQLGDPLEVQALGAVFGVGRAADQPLLIGSVKTNVGHLEAAAGVAGLIKLVLALRHREVPAHLHFSRPSPHIRWDDWAVRVPSEATPWQPIGGRRIAGLSSFGFSGTNAHVVVEEAPASPAAALALNAPQRQQLFVLSARDPAALAELARRHSQSLAERSDAELPDVCFSAAAGKAHFAHRAAIVAASVAQLRERLDELAAGQSVDGVRTAHVTRRDPPRIAFLFTGQGAQYAGMARALYDEQPAFRESLDRCAAVLDTVLPRPLLDVLFPAPGVASPLDETAYTQPALFALEVALAALWRSWGVAPDAVIGHSVGELAAACVAGVIGLDDALRLVAERGRLMQSLPAGGAMAAIAADEDDVAAAMVSRSQRVAIAALNGAQQTVISGAAADVEAVCVGFVARGVRCQRLPVSHAFHSPLVEPILDAFERAVSTLRLSRPELRMVSNLSGRFVDAREVTQPEYWRRHLREPVRFVDGLRALSRFAPDICIEIGPQPVLLALAEQAFGEIATTTLAPSLRKGRADGEQLAESLGTLYLAGHAIDWRAVWSATPHRLVDLPAYPFQRERCWFRARSTAVQVAGRDSGHPLLGVQLRSALRDAVQFERRLAADELPFLRDHQVQGRVIMPAAGFIEMARAAATIALCAGAGLDDIVLSEPLAFVGHETRVVQLVVRRGATVAFEILSQLDGDAPDAWLLHASGRCVGTSPPNDSEPLEQIRARCTEHRDAASHREQLAALGLAFGASLLGVQAIDRRDGEALARIELPEPSTAGVGEYGLHPALLDACLQSIAAALPSQSTGGRAYLPLAIDRMRHHAPPRGAVLSHAVVHGTTAQTLHADVTVRDELGHVVAELLGVALRPAPQAARVDDVLYEVAWQRDDGATWLLPPASLAEQAGALLDPLADEHGLQGYDDGFAGLESLATAWIAQAFGELGWNPRPGEHVVAESLGARLGVVPRYRRLLARLLSILAEDGMLRAGRGGFAVLRTLPQSDAAARLPLLLEQHPSSSTRFHLVANCGPALTDILRGAADPLQHLFPGGSTELAESLYRDTPEAKVFNQLMRETLRIAIAAQPAGRRLRVLEVGGGTGGTTAWLVPMLPAAQTDYLFTDVGPLLVERAREKFAAHPFIDFQTLDLEREPAAQGLGDRRFDIVVASNVVHATAHVRATLGRLRELLDPGGTLLMLEVAGAERWIDITFGLTEGWWRFDDAPLRTDHPLLSRSRWLELLAETGFDAAAIDDARARSRQLLLAARKTEAVTVENWMLERRWLIVADTGGVADALATKLHRAGQQTVVAPADEAGAALAASDGLHAVVYLAALDLHEPDEHEPDALRTTQLKPSLGSLLAMVQALGTQLFGAAATPRLWIGTCGAQSIDDDDAPLNVAQAATWGLGKVIDLEHAELRASCVDLDPAESPDERAATLLRELQRADAERQIAWRSGSRFVARLCRSVGDDGIAAVQLENTDSGVINDLALVPLQPASPAPGEVQIRVVAAGLNFRDVMNAVAMRADPEPLGGECAGRVVAVGDGVAGIAIGDDVVAVAEGCFATLANADARNVAQLPRGMSHAAAATLPFAYMTALHALVALGALTPRDTVLIHAGAGGVGMAAIGIARRIGARVIATAGSEAKRAMLRGLGVAHVFDSRGVGFADDVLRVTGGHGADVVLNSLAGEIIGASVRCLAEAGRFLEIGKRELWSEARFHSVRPAAAYHRIDLAALRHDDPQAAFELFAEVMRRVAQGELKPLPLRAFPLERAADAFRFMAQARHVGKVVLMPRDANGLERLRSDATYLVTGGLSGLGLLTASRFVERGARHLLLAGRRAPGEAALAAIATMREASVEVVVRQADVSRSDDVAALLTHVDAAMPPLRGIVHSAGALDDGALLQLDWPRFATPLGAKVSGSWALHALTRRRPLDFFVMYSSVASVLGSAGQGNHAAANAFIDALARHRRMHGLPGLSISWGAWSEVGAAAERGVEQRVGERGIDAIDPRRGLDLLERVMRGRAPHVAVFPVRWQKFLADGAVPRFLETLADTTRTAPTSRVATPHAAAVRPSIADALHQSAPTRRHDLLLGFVGEQVAQVLRAPSAQSIDVRQPLNELGLDSLMAVELRNRLGTGLGLARGLPATLVFDHPTLDALARYLTAALAPADAASTAPAAAPCGDAVDAIDELSDDEVEVLLAAKMQRR